MVGRRHYKVMVCCVFRVAVLAVLLLCWCFRGVLLDDVRAPTHHLQADLSLSLSLSLFLSLPMQHQQQLLLEHELRQH